MVSSIKVGNTAESLIFLSIGPAMGPVRLVHRALRQYLNRCVLRACAQLGASDGTGRTARVRIRLVEALDLQVLDQ